jgi:hypothetical protein
VTLVGVASRTYGAHVEGFLIERYWPGVTLDDVARLSERLVRMGSVDATFVGSLLVQADELVLFEFLAFDAQAALEVSGSVGLRCDRIVSVRRVFPVDR